MEDTVGTPAKTDQPKPTRTQNLRLSHVTTYTTIIEMP